MMTSAPGVAAKAPLPGEVIPFSDHAAWHALRAADLTASSIAGHFGFSAWSTSYSDHVEKAGLAPRDTKDTPLTRAGRHMEAAIAALAAESEEWGDRLWDAPAMARALLGAPSDGVAGVYLRCPLHRLGATPDRLLDDRGALRPVEIKNVSFQAWRDDWQDGQPPVKYWLQGQVQAGLLRRAGLPAGGPIVVALVAGHDLRVCPFDFDPDAYARCEEAADAFWREVEAGRVPEPNVALQADRDALRRRWRQSRERTEDLTAVAEAQMVAESLHEARARQRAAEKEADMLSARLLHLIGDAEAALLPGGWTAIAKSSDRAGYTVKPTTIRAIRLKPPVAQEKAKLPAEEAA